MSLKTGLRYSPSSLMIWYRKYDSPIRGELQIHHTKPADGVAAVLLDAGAGR
jgi:hypothetical protein